MEALEPGESGLSWASVEKVGMAESTGLKDMWRLALPRVSAQSGGGGGGIHIYGKQSWGLCT